MRSAPRAATLVAASLLLIAFTAQTTVSCGVLPEWLPGLVRTPTSPPRASATPTQPPGAAETELPAQTPVPPSELTIWLPPEFNPEGEDKAAALLQQRLDAFSQANDIQIKIRLKAPSGPGGLIESLSAAAAAAPVALPALTALTRSDMETAAIKGLLTPLEGYSTALDDEDWYEYARQLARVKNTSFGLPFAGDALLIVYRPTQITPSPSSWEAILALNQPFAFPAASPQALTTIALYRSAGGEIEDAQGRPMLENDSLIPVFELYGRAAAGGVFPIWLTQFESDAQVWQAFEDNRVNMVLTWSSYFLSQLPADTNALPMPALSAGSTSLATGWAWTVTDPLPERRLLSIRLAEWLSDPTFLGAWTEAAGYLPTRPAALDAWRNGSLKALLRQVALNTRARPSNDLLFSLGPVLRDSALSVIRLESDAATAADTATQRISSPPPP